jgi:hypothetical protein
MEILNEYHCCPINSLSLRERVGERGSEYGNCLICYPLILTFSRREKGRSFDIEVTGIHVHCVITSRLASYSRFCGLFSYRLWDSSE